MPERKTSMRGGNLLLAGLGPEDARRVEAQLEPVAFELKTTLIHPNRPISHAYFVDSGIISVVAELEDGRMIEVATVGVEGMIGVPLFLSASETATRAFVQVVGAGRRMTAEAFLAEIGRGGQLRTKVERYAQLTLEQISQTTACNRGHAVQQRCARWILRVHDQLLRPKRFELTQEFLAQMLGVRRASVAVVAASLQRAGVIEYARGIMAIVDRRRLEQLACGCYRKIKDAQQRWLGGPA